MLLAEITFRPKLPSAVGKSALEERVECLLAGLMRNGQIGRDYVWGWVTGRLRVTVTTPHRDGLSSRYFTKWSREEHAKVTAICSGRPLFRVLDDRAVARRLDWKKAGSLYLFTDSCETASPIRSGKDGTRLPAYLFPFSDAQLDELFFWQSSYGEFDGIWLTSRALEIPAYRQCADPGSELSRDGRDLCQQIEADTGLPTYYYLMRYWGRRKREEDRRCPSCGGRWARKADPDSRGLDWFDFLCRKCRLVSHIASCDDEPRYAAIGEHRPRRGRK